MIKHIVSKIFIVCLFLQVVSIASAAHAKNENDIFARFKKDMPEIAPIEEDEFLKMTKPLKKVPYNMGSLAYTIRIPKEWDEGEEARSSNFLLSEKLFIQLNTFYGKPTISGRSRIDVEALKIDNNLTVEQWYLKFILEGGYTTTGFKTHNENKVETLMVVSDKDFSYYVRSLAVLNGEHIMMVKYYVPVNFINEQAALQAQVIETFEVVNKKKRAFPEMDNYRFLDVAEVKFPLGWKSFPKPLRAVDYMDVTIMNIKEFKDDSGRVKSSSSMGKVDVVVVSSKSRGTLLEEIDIFKKAIEGSGVLIGDKIDLYGEFSYHKDIEFGITEAYEGVDSSNNLSEYEFWFTVAVGGNYYYFIVMLTPSRNENFGVWADNIQNYNIMIKKFRPLAGAFLERE